MEGTHSLPQGGDILLQRLKEQSDEMSKLALKKDRMSSECERLKAQ